MGLSKGSNSPIRGWRDRVFAAAGFFFVVVFVGFILILLIADALYIDKKAVLAVLGSGYIRDALWRSVWTSFATTSIALLFAVPIGYSLSRFQTRVVTACDEWDYCRRHLGMGAGVRTLRPAAYFRRFLPGPDRCFEHHYFPRTILERVGQTAEMLGIGYMLKRSIIGISGGERQRVALARALVLQPKVLLLDEPAVRKQLGPVRQRTVDRAGTASGPD